MGLFKRSKEKKDGKAPVTEIVVLKDNEREKKRDKAKGDSVVAVDNKTSRALENAKNKGDDDDDHELNELDLQRRHLDKLFCLAKRHVKSTPAERGQSLVTNTTTTRTLDTTSGTVQLENRCSPMVLGRKTGTERQKNEKSKKDTGKTDTQTVATSCTFLDFADNLCGKTECAGGGDLRRSSDVMVPPGDGTIISIPREISFEHKTPSPIADYSVLDNMEEQQIVRRQPALLSRIKRKKTDELKIKVYVDKPDASNRTETENDDYSALTTPSALKSM